jgi:hypothetical protein
LVTFTSTPGADSLGTSDHKSEAIEEDGRDPDFAKKLNTMGQVNVPEFKTKYRPVSVLWLFAYCMWQLY